MFDIGLQELVVIFVLALLVFGPKNLPQLGRSLGRAMREFKRASDEFRSTIETNLEINAPDPVITPVPDPVASEPAPTAVTTATEGRPDTGLDSHTPGEVATATEEPPGEPYLAQRGGRLVHARDCGWAKKVAEPERQYFKRLTEAKEAGFLACPSCDPWEPA
ncbi:MAG: twin-arginine translocase TatA/TatE family subunit [Candidatus Rokubacteria bacterium]|nr:twin-arginine translocase TatA/TatE family subunit [Candidatus Rokubacteria bacterium]